MVVPIPLSASNVRIYANVRFARDYSHVRYFASATERDDYFSTRNLIYSANQVKFVRHDVYQGIYRCNRNIETIQNANYITFSNEGQRYYAFIDNVVYVNDNCCEIYFTVDYYQTNLFKLTFFQSMIEREHRTRYLSNGQPQVNTVPEGLDYGDAYETKSVTRIQPFGDIQFLVIVCKRDFHTEGDNEIKPTLNGIPQGLSYYIHPFTPDGNTPTTNVGGATVTLSDLDRVLGCMFNSTSAVENVVQMFITDNPGLNVFMSGSTVQFNTGQVEQVSFVYDGTSGFTLHLKNASQYTTYIEDLGNKYSGVSNPSESKLLMYPYTVYYLTDLKGNQVEIRPELISGTNLRIQLQGSMGVSNKTAYIPMNYQHNSVTNGIHSAYQNALICDVPATTPIISDYLSAYLQGNANSVQARLNSTFVNGMLGAVNGSVAIAGAIATRGASSGASSGAPMGIVNSTTNAVMDIQSQQAQLKDIGNIPPNLSSQGANINFDSGNGRNGVFLIKKQIRSEYMNTLSDFFKVYGYKVNMLKNPNFRSREAWDYIKMEPNVVANIPGEQLEAIRNIFRKGVTLWHVNNMLDYSQSNNER